MRRFVCAISILMPSIEIICVDQARPTKFQASPFALEAENKLVSHRCPAPLFQPELDTLRGCIYHLGNPALRDPAVLGCYTAYELLSKERGTEWWEIIHFSPEYVLCIKVLLEQLLAASPGNRVLFTSDYQFGPDAKIHQRPVTLEEFWRLHDDKKLQMNALYPLEP